MAKTARDYWNSVEAIAQDTRTEYPDPDDDGRQEYIWETVNGSEWIMYYSNNETVLSATDNHDAIDGSGLEPTTDWKQNRLDCALYAMLQDVQDAISKVRE